MIFIRGIAVANSVERILVKYGKETYIQIVENLRKEDREIFFNKIIAADLYPLDSFVRFIKAEVHMLYNGDITRILINSEEILERQLRGVFRSFIRDNSPSFVINEMSKITQAYLEGVTLEPMVIANGRFIGRLIGLKKAHDIMQYPIIAFFKKALEISGAKNVQVKFTIPISDNPDYSEITATWGVQIIL